MKQKLPKKYDNFNTWKSTKYDHLFEPEVRGKAQIYYSNKRVKSIINKNGIYYADVIGINTYKVKLNLNKIKESTCECPYYKNGKYCKHIYSLLLVVKMAEERKQTIKYITKYSNELSNLTKKLDSIIESNKDKLDKYEIEIFKDNIEKYKEILTSSKRQYETLEDLELFKILKSLNFNFNEINENITDIKTRIINNKRKLEKKENKMNFNIESSNNDKTGIFNKMLLLSLLLKDDKKSKNNDYLMPWEEKEVKKDKYSPFNFEEEDLEDDDYYKDDLD